MRGCRRRFATVQCSPTFKHDSMTALVVSHGMFTKKNMELDRLSNKQMDVSRFGLTFLGFRSRDLPSAGGVEPGDISLPHTAWPMFPFEV